MKLFIGMLMLIFSSTVLADIGSVSELTGLVVIKRGKESITVSKGTVIVTNDKIEAKNGKLKIIFKDDTTVSVAEHSSLVIDDFVYDPNSKKGKLGIRATGGTVRYVSGAIAKDPKNVNIKTPTAAIAVRGTDFVMSVNEIGSSMIILMPSCEKGEFGGATCVSGKIDVQTEQGIIIMDKPYQATFVETASAPPSPPIIVNLAGAPIGNNLQITPPRTEGGGSIVVAARAAVAATSGSSSSGATRSSSASRSSSSSSAAAAPAAASDDTASTDKPVETKMASAKAEDAAKEKVTTSVEAPKVVEIVTDLAAAVADSTVAPTQETIQVAESTETEIPYLKKVWKDKSETQQIGWAYEALSATKKNYVYVNLPLDTQVQVNLSQDMMITNHNFSAGKAQGSINITQIYR